MSAAPDPRFDPERERLRVRVSVAFMLAGALEVQARISRDLDPALHQLLVSAHGQALHVMAKARAELRAYQRSTAGQPPEAAAS
jgi:hypothetical protein